jgi:collagen type VI alpha
VTCVTSISEKALAALYNNVFNTTNDQRSDVPNVALILTDGKSNNEVETIMEADNAKNAGIRLVVTATGTDIGNFEIESIASYPISENVYHVDNFANLANIGPNLVQILFDECDGKYCAAAACLEILFILDTCFIKVDIWL